MSFYQIAVAFLRKRNCFHPLLPMTQSGKLPVSDMVHLQLNALERERERERVEEGDTE